jgi:hypothetical protein
MPISVGTCANGTRFGASFYLVTIYAKRASLS